MIVNKAYRFRLYPNKKQTESIHKTIGCSRFVFNFFLCKQKELINSLCVRFSYTNTYLCF
ncbi:MAG TPA: helix-turn-helix domain-containing protein [Bacillus sp. (in: firmicutes)]|nr:helix-turn-helix domain-containing protein [Bacillus sp. (in: firmicutes)]